MIEFAYKNAKNINTGYNLFEFNCGYYLHISYKKDVNPRSKLKLAKKLSNKLRKLITICRINLHHAQELQNQAHDKVVKPKSHTPSNKV